MTALETFNVSNNELCGAIPERIGALSRLRKLDLSNNRFSGDIPVGLGDLSSLSWLHLDHNRFTGPVHSSFGNLRGLLIVNLSFNRLCGPLPPALAFLSGLTTVSLRGNSFEGPFQFPSKYRCFFKTASGMRTLDLGSNDADEPFPDMAGMRQLQSLALDGNRIYGRLPEGLAEACPNLFRLDLRNNRLSGEASNWGCPDHALFLLLRTRGWFVFAPAAGPAVSTCVGGTQRFWPRFVVGSLSAGYDHSHMQPENVLRFEKSARGKRGDGRSRRIQRGHGWRFTLIPPSSAIKRCRRFARWHEAGQKEGCQERGLYLVVAPENIKGENGQKFGDV